jgi:hypothetical protein
MVGTKNGTQRGPDNPGNDTELAGTGLQALGDGLQIRAKAWITSGDETFLAYGRIVLLEKIRECGSISAAARSIGMSYRRAWWHVETMNRFVTYLDESENVFITGSRLSYTFAYYLGWSLTKIRKGIHIFNGSDSTTIDFLTNAPPNSLVILTAATRYPNELIKLSKLVRRLEHTLLVLTDASISPVIPFANLSLVVPSRSIPFIGNVSNMLCVIQYMVQELASRRGEDLQKHQEQLEQVYMENDILFNLMVP